MKEQNRKYLIVALGVIFLFALLLFVLSRAVAGTQSDLLLWGVVLTGAATFLAALKDIIDLVERYWPNSEKAAPEKLKSTSFEEIDTPSVSISSKETGGSIMSPDLSSSPYYSCFISYSSKDEEFAEQLHSDLKNEGVNCWYAKEHLGTGARMRQSFEEEIIDKSKTLLILSKTSINSHWVEAEAEAAFEWERKNDSQLKIFPIRIDDEIMSTEIGWAAYIRRTRMIGDFRDWQDDSNYEKSLKKILRDLKPSR